MTVLHFDIETFSEADLKQTGVYRYAEHPSTEFYVLGYRFDDEPVVTQWIPFNAVPVDIVTQVYLRTKEKYGDKYEVKLKIGNELPYELRAHITKGRDVDPNAPGGEMRCHNAQFERVVLSGTAGKRVNFPKLTIEQFVCTAAKVAAHGLPRALGDAAEALGTHPKDEAGRISMLQLAKPRKPTKADPSTRWTFANAPEKYIEVLVYNVDDVLAECGVDDAVPDLSPDEQKVYQLDQLINQRGIRVDLQAIANVKALIDEYKAFLAAACEKATRSESDKWSKSFDWLVGTDGYPEQLDPQAGFKPTQRDKIAEWVRANGYPQLLDMQADTVKGIIKDPAVPDCVKHVLRIYSTYNAKAVTKFDAILDAVCADGRLRGMFLFHGANTGRFSALLVQLHNLFRPVIDDPETAIEAFSSRNLEWIKALYPDHDPMKIFASTVRGMLIADDGKDLVFPDYSGIESRGVAWLFDEEWKLQGFRDYDTILRDEETGEILLDDKGEPLRKGPDNYKSSYARSFGVDIKSVTKPKRQIGKVQELFMSYEGGVGAFVTGAETYGIDLNELAAAVTPTLPQEIRAQAERMWEEMPQHRAGVEHDVFIACDSLKRMWRNAHPRIKQGWKDIKGAAEMAVQFPGKAFSLPNGKIAFKVIEYKGRSWLYMRLPSGRRIAYYKPRWIPEEIRVVKDQWGNEIDEVIPGEMRYWGTDTYTRRWMEVSTYGGKLTENAVQGLCACILRIALFALEENNYPAIGSVHDEPITEPDTDHGSLEEAGALMCAPIKWAPGFPLAVDGHRGQRYRK